VRPSGSSRSTGAPSAPDRKLGLRAPEWASSDLERLALSGDVSARPRRGRSCRDRSVLRLLRQRDPGRATSFRTRRSGRAAARSTTRSDRIAHARRRARSGPRRRRLVHRKHEDARPHRSFAASMGPSRSHAQRSSSFGSSAVSTRSDHRGAGTAVPPGHRGGGARSACALHRRASP